MKGLSLLIWIQYQDWDLVNNVTVYVHTNRDTYIMKVKQALGIYDEYQRLLLQFQMMANVLIVED